MFGDFVACFFLLHKFIGDINYSSWLKFEIAIKGCSKLLFYLGLRSGQRLLPWPPPVLMPWPQRVSKRWEFTGNPKAPAVVWIYVPEEGKASPALLSPSVGAAGLVVRGLLGQGHALEGSWDPSSPFPSFVHGCEVNWNAFAHLSPAHDMSLAKSGGAVASQNDVSRLPQPRVTAPGGLLNIRASKRDIGPKMAVFAYDIISFEDI